MTLSSRDEIQKLHEAAIEARGTLARGYPGTGQERYTAFSEAEAAFSRALSAAFATPGEATVDALTAAVMATFTVVWKRGGTPGSVEHQAEIRAAIAAMSPSRKEREDDKL